MSAQNTLSRREALSLLGATSGSTVATTLIAQTAGAQLHEVIGRATSTKLACGRDWARLGKLARGASLIPS